MGVGPGKRFVDRVTVDAPSGPRAWVMFHAKGSGELEPVTRVGVRSPRRDPILFSSSRARSFAAQSSAPPLSAQEREEGLAVGGGELAWADARDCEELGFGLRVAVGHLHQRRVAEDDVGRDVTRLGELLA